MIVFRGDGKREKVELFLGRVREGSRFKNYFIVEGDRIGLNVYDLVNYVLMKIYLVRDESLETKVLRLWTGTEVAQGKFYVEKVELHVLKGEE